MARFRFHRQLLADSKATEIEVGSLQELMDYYNSHEDWLLHVTKLSCEFYCTDNRPEGYAMTYIIMAEFAHDSDKYPLGFSDELLN